MCCLRCWKASGQLCRFRDYITCCLIGSCFGVPAQAYLGSQLGDIYLGFRDAEEVAKTDPMIIWGGAAPALAMLVLMPTVAKVLWHFGDHRPCVVLQNLMHSVCKTLVPLIWSCAHAMPKPSLKDARP
eukprot:g21497.t1